MPVHSEWIRFGDHTGFLALPERGARPMPAVLVIQEIWGVEEHIEDVAGRLAAAGYAALAPDLFAEHGTRPEALHRHRIAEVQAFMSRLPPAAWRDAAARELALAALPEPERKRIEETRAAIFSVPADLPRCVPVLRDAVRHLSRERPETAGQKVACVGFCMGGGLSALLACDEPELSGAAIYYGSAPPADRIPRIQCPVIGFYAGLDERINAGLPGFTGAMQAAGKAFEAHVYEGAVHGFFNDRSPGYHLAAARDSYARLLDFLRRTAGT